MSPRIRRPLVLLTVLAALLIATGCSAAVSGAPSPDPAPAPTAGPGADPTAWMDRFCGAVLSFSTAATAQPDFGSAADLATVQSRYSEYLDKVITGVRDGRTALDGLGQSPVKDGDAAVDRVRDGLTRLEQDVTGAKATVDAADPTNPDAFVASISQVEATLGTVAVPDVLGDTGSVPRLARAAEQAQNCQQVSTLAAAAPR